VHRNGDEDQLKQVKELRAKLHRLRPIKDELTKPQRAELKSTYKKLKKLLKEAEKFALDGKLRRSMKRLI